MSYIMAHPAFVWDLFLRHLEMTLIAISVGFGIAFPLALLITRFHWLTVPLIGTLGMIYTIPSLAMIIVFIPLFGLNQTSVIIAMIIYVQIVLVRNIVAGFRSVNPITLEAARAMGMNYWQRLFKVQLPLALPVILAGVRIGTVVAIGIATLGADFDAGGLGTLLFTGMSEDRSDKLWAGALTVSAFALLANLLLLALEKLSNPQTRQNIQRSLLLKTK